jgi:anaerobic magnesium-protoporphyrin IX monomethyl ester cyclase
MKSPEILFIYPKPSQGYGPDSFVTYFGTTYLQAFLKQKGIATQQFIQDDYFTMSKLIEKICNTNAKIIGFTCYDTNYYYVRLLAEAIKKVDPQKKIIVGGPTATFSDKLIMEECPGIDTCFQGESEFSLYEIIYKSFENPDEIEGITYRQDTVIKQNKNRPLIFAGPGGEELNILPSPYLSGIIDETWKGNLAIQSVRGCRFDCTYCNFPGISGHRLRYFSIERVLGELEIIGYLNRKLKKNVIFVFDDNFGGNKERAKLLCRAMLDANIKLPLRVDIRVESLDRELIRMMSELGFFSVNIGLESANPKVLRNINKVLTINSTDNDYKIEKNFLKKVSRVVKWAQEENLAISVSIIQGLPGEGIHEAKETLEFVEKLGVKYYYHNQLKIFPGTKLFNHHKRFGINIVKSAATLPYNTIPAYDLRKVPPRKNSDVYGLNKSIAYDLISHYWGTWNFDSFWSRNRYILLDDVEKINSEFLEWLKHFIFLFDNIAIRSSSAMDKKATEEIHAKILNAHIPSNRIYFIIPANGAVPGEFFFERMEPGLFFII